MLLVEVLPVVPQIWFDNVGQALDRLIEFDGQNFTGSHRVAEFTIS